MDVEQLIQNLPYCINDKGLIYYLAIGKTGRGKITVSYDLYDSSSILFNMFIVEDSLKSALEKMFNYLSAHKPLVFNLIGR